MITNTFANYSKEPFALGFDVMQQLHNDLLCAMNARSGGTR